MATELEKRLYNELARAYSWLDNLFTQHGVNAMMDCCPNNWGGRFSIREALKDAEAKHPELVFLPPGTFVTDGIVHAFVKGRGMMGAIPCYRVDIGGGRDSLIPCDQARRV